MRILRGFLLMAGADLALACSAEAPGPEPTGSVAGRLEPGVYRLQSVASGMCAEVSMSEVSNGANILLGYCGAGDNQKWQFIPRPDHSFRIAAVHSGKCMVAVGKPAAEDDNVQQGRCIYKRSKWLVTELGSEVVRLASVKSDLCVGDSAADWGYDLRQWECDDTDEQQLRLSLSDSAAETGCLASGGSVAEAFCCSTTLDFPNTCLPGACACPPESSRWVLGCNCPPGTCFDGTNCVAEH